MFYIVLYIDPSSGSLIFQGILSLLISSALFFKQLKFRVINLVKWLSRYAGKKG
jgi:hypothetical protein